MHPPVTVLVWFDGIWIEETIKEDKKSGFEELTNLFCLPGLMMKVGAHAHYDKTMVKWK